MWNQHCIITIQTPIIFLEKQWVVLWIQILRYFPFFVFIESILWLYFDYAALIFHRWIHKSHISNEYWSNYFNRIVFTIFIPLNPIQSIGIHTIHICLWDSIIMTMISFFIVLMFILLLFISFLFIFCISSYFVFCFFTLLFISQLFDFNLLFIILRLIVIL